MPGQVGRPKGSRAKNKRGLLARLQQEFGKDYNPVLSMARIAHEVDENGDFVADSNTRFGYHEKIANFTVPRLKQVEHVNDDGPLVVQLLKYADDSDTE
jgi:hypothetical protein